MPGRVRIGISGWTYKPWRGVFYPPALAHKRELQFAASQFESIEINGTFYGLQRPSSFERWAAETPNDFVFSVKGSRFITHMLRLRNIEVPLANFFASGPLKLGTKLGPILWQFPANFRFDPAVFESFLQLLPADMESAANLARLHDDRLKDRAFFDLTADIPGNHVGGGTGTSIASHKVRHAVEIRNESFVTPVFMSLLRRYNVALVVADAVEWPLLMDATADFVYCRLHGSKELYVSGYEEEALDVWAERVCAWATGRARVDTEGAARYADPLGAAGGRKNAHRDSGNGGPARAVKPPGAACLAAEPWLREPADRGQKTSEKDVFVYFDNDAKVRAPVDAKGLIKRVQKSLPALK